MQQQQESEERTQVKLMYVATDTSRLWMTSRLWIFHQNASLQAHIDSTTGVKTLNHNQVDIRYHQLDVKITN